MRAGLNYPDDFFHISIQFAIVIVWMHFQIPNYSTERIDSLFKNLNLLEIFTNNGTQSQEFIKYLHLPHNVWGYLENILQSPLFKRKHCLCL